MRRFIAALAALLAVFTAKLIDAKDSPVAATSGWKDVAAVDSPALGNIRFRLKAPDASAIDAFFNAGHGYSMLPERLLRERICGP